MTSSGPQTSCISLLGRWLGLLSVWWTWQGRPTHWTSWLRPATNGHQPTQADARHQVTDPPLTCPHVHTHNRDRRSGRPGHGCHQNWPPSDSPLLQCWNHVTPLSGHLWRVGTCCSEPSMHPIHGGRTPRHLPNRYRLRRPLTPSLSRNLDPSTGPHVSGAALQSPNHPEDGVISVICTRDTNRDARTAIGDSYGGCDPPGTASRTGISAARIHCYHDTERSRIGCETPRRHGSVLRQWPAIVPDISYSHTTIVTHR